MTNYSLNKNLQDEDYATICAELGLIKDDKLQFVLNKQR